jgi:hypothetical protein
LHVQVDFFKTAFWHLGMAFFLGFFCGGSGPLRGYFPVGTFLKTAVTFHGTSQQENTPLPPQRGLCAPATPPQRGIAIPSRPSGACGIGQTGHAKKNAGVWSEARSPQRAAMPCRSQKKGKMNFGDPINFRQSGILPFAR